MPSLQDQLLNAGLVDKKKAKQVSKNKRKQANVERRSKEQTVDENKAAAEEARLAKQERDRELNRQRQEAAEQKAVAAQIQQLIQNHAKPLLEGAGEVEYNFTDGKTIKRLLVSQPVQRQLVNGVLVIAKKGEGYAVVPSVVAEKIAQRDEAMIIRAAAVSATEVPEEDDPYKDYVIPDDLMW